MSVATIAPMAEKTNNFLVPNGTFFVELIAFAIIVFILGKYVIPPINKAMTARQDAIRKQFADLDQAHGQEEDRLKATLGLGLTRHTLDVGRTG
jgi:F-type H+-transporting ATPase subunit b